MRYIFLFDPGDDASTNPAVVEFPDGAVPFIPNVAELVECGDPPTSYKVISREIRFPPEEPVREIRVFFEVREHLPETES